MTACLFDQSDAGRCGRSRSGTAQSGRDCVPVSVRSRCFRTDEIELILCCHIVRVAVAVAVSCSVCAGAEWSQRTESGAGGEGEAASGGGVDAGVGDRSECTSSGEGARACECECGCDGPSGRGKHGKGKRSGAVADRDPLDAREARARQRADEMEALATRESIGLSTKHA